MKATENDASSNGSEATSPTCQARFVEPLGPLEGAGLLDHRRGQVDAGDVAGVPGEVARQQAGAAGHVEDRVARADARRIPHEPDRFLRGVGRHPGEWDGLAGELIDDQPTLVLGGLGHSYLRSSCKISGAQTTDGRSGFAAPIIESRTPPRIAAYGSPKGRSGKAISMIRSSRSALARRRWESG